MHSANVLIYSGFASKVRRGGFKRLSSYKISTFALKRVGGIYKTESVKMKA